MNEMFTNVFKGIELECFNHNDKALFNPYQVGECLEISKSNVRNYLAKMNTNQAVMLKKSDVHNMDFRKLNNRGEKFITCAAIAPNGVTHLQTRILPNGIPYITKRLRKEGYLMGGMQ